MANTKNAKAMSEALDAIYDEAMNLLKFDMPDEVSKGLMLIISLSQYKHDVRSDEEKEIGSTPDIPERADRRKRKTKPLDMG